MACVCGCDVDNHLQNLPNKPTSPNSFFENFRAPNLAEMLVSRLRTVLNESEPSRRVFWRERFGGDSQDVIHPHHKWALISRPSDKSRGCESPWSTLPTPDYEKLAQEELMQDRQYILHDFSGFEKQIGSINKEEDSQNLLLPPKRAPRAISFRPQETIIRTSFPNALDQPVPDSSQKLATHALPLQSGQGYPASCNPPSNGQHDHSERPSPRKLPPLRRRISPASPHAKPTKEAVRESARRNDEAVNSPDRLTGQAATPWASLSERCFCGCGVDLQHCHLANRPPSPNTFYQPERFLALQSSPSEIQQNYRSEHYQNKSFKSTFPASQTYTRQPLREEELQRSVMWGGCSPDRETLRLELCTIEADDREGVPKASPPPFGDDRYGSRSREKNGFSLSRKRKRQHSTSPLNSFIRNQDEPANSFGQSATYDRDYASKGIPHHEVGEDSTNESRSYRTHLGPSRQSHTRTPTTSSEARSTKTEQPTEDSVLLWQELEAATPKNNCRLGTNMSRCMNAAGGNLTSAVNEFPVHEADEKSIERFSHGWTHTEDSSKSLFRASIVRSKTQSPKSSTLSIPKRCAPLYIPHFSGNRPLRKREGLTAQEDGQLQRASLRIEANKTEIHDLFYVTPLEQGVSAETPASNPQGDHPREVPSKIRVKEKESTAEEFQQLKHSLYEKIEDMKMRRSRRQGTAIYRTDDVAAESSPTTSCVYRSAELSPTKLPTFVGQLVPSYPKRVFHRRNTLIGYRKTRSV